MEKFETDNEEKKNIPEVQTYTVPLDLGETKEKISITTNTPPKPSKEQLINQAIQFHLKGNISEAAKYYKYCIKQGFNDSMVFSNYGDILKSIGALQEAELYTRKAIELNPNFVDAHYNLGITLIELGKLQEAELSTRKAIELKPDLADAHYNLGNILSDLGKLQEAELSYRKAIELKPDFAEAYSNLGTILKTFGKLQAAELSYRKAIELKPDYADAHSNLGLILNDLGKLQAAELSTRKAIELKPDCADAHYNLGLILNNLGKLQAAELSTRKAIEINPDYAEAYCNLSMIELLKGDYKNGLENYEFRFKKKKPIITHGNTKIKRVDNQEFQKGEKLLVLSEQGLGDTLQYMRYIPYLRSQGLDVSFSAQEKLHTLIKVSGIDCHPLTPEKTNLVSEGQWIPLLSLPRYLKVTPKNPIINQPYICSTNELNQKWKDILAKEKKPIVGINWQGNPDMENTYQGRSIPLETFSILSDNNEISMLSLQKGFGSEQYDHCSFKNKFVKCQPQIDSTWDFLENTAIIENCDLIITCDTSIAHLAGGMGTKVWLLLREIPFWTWGLEGDTTFWYPSMRLFRQKERHNWQEVLERVSSKIKKEIEAKV